MEKLDRKFRLLATNPCKKGSVQTEYDSVLFLARDKYLPEIILNYIQLLERDNVDEVQIDGVRLLLHRVEKWQKENKDQVKTPDIDDGCEMDMVMKPNQL